jgi:cyclopropane-fatty-acyl-phospholipid synthase
VKEGGLVMNHGITAKHTDGRPVGRGAGDHREIRIPQRRAATPAMISAEISEAGLRSSMSKACACTTHAPWTTGASAWRITSKPPKLVPDQALRIWRLYLAGCAYAFAGAGSTCTRSWR